jgi:hypothetical protein
MQNIGTHVDLAWQLGLPVLALRSTVKSHEFKKSYIPHGPYSKQQKLQEHSISIDHTIIREKALQISAHLGVVSFTGSNRSISRFQ